MGNKFRKMLKKFNLKQKVKGKMDDISYIGATALGWKIDAQGHVHRPEKQTEAEKKKEAELLKRAEKVLGKKKIAKLKKIIKEEKPELTEEEQ